MQVSTKKSRMLQNIAHPISTGTTALVIDLDDKGAYVDGLATINEPWIFSHAYRVRFLGDTCERIRIVHPAGQHDPLGVVDLFNALERLRRQQALDEFFRSDDRTGG